MKITHLIPFLPAEGEDFSGTSGNITLAPGNTELCVNIPITDDKNIEPPESFAVTFMFMEVPPGTTSPPPISAMVTIIDNGTKPEYAYLVQKSTTSLTHFIYYYRCPGGI